MAVSYVNETTATALSGTSLTINAPASITNGDLLVLAINGGSGQSAFTASGWTTLVGTYTDGQDTAGAVFYKIASSEPASYTVSWTTATGGCVATIRHFAGNSTTTPTRTSRRDTAVATGASFASTALSGVLSTDMTVLIGQMGDDSGSTTFTVTEPGAPWTSIDNVTTVRPKWQGAVYATGSQSGATFTSSSSTAWWNIVSFAIEAASGGGTATPADPVGLTDAVAVVRTLGTLADSVGATDTTALGRSPAAADPVGATDVASSGGVLNTAPADPVGLTDTSTQTQAFVRAPADPVGATDAATAVISHVVSAADPVGLTDTVKLSRTKSAADPVGITDAKLVTGTFTVPITTTAEPDLETTVALNDVVSLHGVADVTADFPTANLVKGPQRASVDFTGDTSNLTHIGALSGTAGIETAVATRLHVVAQMTDVLTRQVTSLNLTVQQTHVPAEPQPQPEAAPEPKRFNRVFTALR